MNRVLRTLILSDLFVLSSFGLIQPIFAVFVITGITGATVAAAGIAVTIQLFTKACFQILVARWADSERGNCRELYALLAGSLIVSLVPLGYALCQDLWQLYLTQFFYGLGQALNYPSWRVLFTRYMNASEAGYEWGVYDTIISFGTAGSAAIGGVLAQQFSFVYLFIFVSILSLVGTSFLTFIFQQEFTCRIKLPKKH